MTDSERIQAELNEMVAGAGGMMSVRTVYALVSQWIDEQDGSYDVASVSAYLDDVDSAASEVANNAHHWVVADRFSTQLFNGYIAQYRNLPFKLSILHKIGGTVHQMDQAYGSAFRPDGAIQYCLDVAKYAHMLQSEINK